MPPLPLLRRRDRLPVAGRVRARRRRREGLAEEHRVAESFL